jgi:hypothetical protein
VVSPDGRHTGKGVHWSRVRRLPRRAARAQQHGPTFQQSPQLVARAQKLGRQGEKIRANRLAAGSGLTKPGLRLETREPLRRRFFSTVSSILQYDYIIITQWLQNINVITSITSSLHTITWSYKSLHWCYMHVILM